MSSMVQPRLLAILSEQLYYDEIAIPFTRMQNECKQLISLLADSNIDLQDRLNCSVFTIDQANELVSPHSTQHNTGHDTTRHDTSRDTAQKLYGCNGIALTGQYVESLYTFLSFPRFPHFMSVPCK